MSVHDTAACGFSLQAQNYESVRPGYTDDVVGYVVALAHLGDGEGKKVLDVGAGTGKLTRQLMVHMPRAHLMAAEPVSAMREEFRRVIGPSVEAVDAAASCLPHPDNSMDAVFVGQAFHWFCDEGSLKEMHRVLKPGGCLCLLWNMEDEAEPVVAALRALYERYDGGIPQYRYGTWRQVFRGTWAAAAFERPDAIAWSSTPNNEGSIPADDASSQILLSRYLWDRSTWASAQQIWQRVLSKSYIAVRTPEQQAELREEIMAVLEQYAAAFEQHAASGVSGQPSIQGVNSASVAGNPSASLEQGWVLNMPIRTEVAVTRKPVLPL